MKLGKMRWIGVAFGATIFLVAFGLALAQQLFQVSREVESTMEVYDMEVLPDEQLTLASRGGDEVERIVFRRYNPQSPLRPFDEASSSSIWITNDTSPSISLYLIDPCRPAVDENTGQEIGHFDADLFSGWSWNEGSQRYDTDGETHVGRICDDGRTRESGISPGETFRMRIRIKFNPEYMVMDMGTYNLGAVVIGGAGFESGGHDPDISVFHNDRVSEEHDPQTSGHHPHDADVSDFHNDNSSENYHNPGVSDFHNDNSSEAHDPQTSGHHTLPDLTIILTNPNPVIETCIPTGCSIDVGWVIEELNGLDTEAFSVRLDLLSVDDQGNPTGFSRSYVDSWSSGIPGGVDIPQVITRYVGVEDGRCFDPGCEISVKIDSLDEITESNEANNVDHRTDGGL